MISARVAAVADGSAVGEVHAASWGAAYGPLFSPEMAREGVASRLERWHERLATGNGLVMLGFVDERPLAMSWSLASETRAGFAEIYSFYTHPDGWGSGVSVALMDATLKHLQADGFERVHLWTLRDTPQSRRFYTKCGFVETGATQFRDFGDGNPLPQVEYALVREGGA
ncbi:RimJ/RimL family protein N-acetyltransferase [Kribbella jejuensis]|uniref:RimJ/RimL family protein N-acetyltransferase n=1 Tax=Kribbella jejuensis TaxID=236068 RepID=A0A542D9B4_9ACTN|nr:RimJ/RimL family protein N-acetyltransferase [Kribbella jejuensis]